MTKPRTWKAWVIVNGSDLMPYHSDRIDIYQTRASARHNRVRRDDRVVRVTITEDSSK